MLNFGMASPEGTGRDPGLIVETRGFNNKGWIATSFSQGRIKGVPHTNRLEVTERFERIGDDTVLWQATVSQNGPLRFRWSDDLARKYMSMPATRGIKR